MVESMSPEELGAALSRLLAIGDAVPESATSAASAAFGWRDLDASLATLISDSRIDEPVAAVRGGPPRLLSFSVGDVTIDLELTSEGGAVRILGQVAPAQPADVVIEYPGGSAPAGADELGRFAVAGLPASWLRVQVSTGPAPQTRVCTEWFRA